MKKKKKTKPAATPNRAGKKPTPSSELRALAEHTERQLNAIQRGMRQRLQAEFARGNLTGPQRLVMSEVTRNQQGLSLNNSAKPSA